MDLQSVSADHDITATATAGDIEVDSLTAGAGINVWAGGTDGVGNITFGAGVTLDAATISVRAGDGPGGTANAVVDIMTNTPTIVADTLTVQQDGQMGNSGAPWNPNVINNASIDLILLSDESSIYTTTANWWESITATAYSGITLLGSVGTITTGALESATGNIEVESWGDLVVMEDVTAHGGGVSLVSENGSIYTDDGSGTLNVSIKGYSDENAGVGVDLPFGSGKAAIVIWMWSPWHDLELKLGPEAHLSALGSYDPLVFDDRAGLGFIGGEPIDVAIYLSNFQAYPLFWFDPDLVFLWKGYDVEMGSGSVWVDNTSGPGTLVIDAWDTVRFTSDFENSLKNPSMYNIERLEVVSRISEDLQWAIAGRGPLSEERSDHGFNLPHALDPSRIAAGLFRGTYVLRGKSRPEGFWWLYSNGARLLNWSDAVPLVPPKTEEPEEKAELARPDMDALLRLLTELGIGVQPYMARAYSPWLSTDLRLYKAAEKLQKLVPIVEDSEGTRVAALRQSVSNAFPTTETISEETMALFAQQLSEHKGDGSDYDLAGQCIFALVEYVDVLTTDIGWPTDRSFGFIMDRYVQRLTEGDEVRTVVIQMHLQQALGV
jgi:hypothetical protein